METNLNFILLEDLIETGENEGYTARIVIVRGSLDAGFVPEQDWISLDGIA